MAEAFLQPKQALTQNKAQGKMPKNDTPPHGNKPFNPKYGRWQTGRAGGYQGDSHSGGTKTHGIANFKKHPSGSGEWVTHGGEVHSRNESGSVVGTKGPAVDYGNGNKSGTNNGANLSRSLEHVQHSPKGQAGCASDNGAAVPRAISKNSDDGAKMETIGGDRGFTCGGKFGVAAEQICLASAGNMSIGSSGSTGISAATDIHMGSQQGCCHVYGVGLAMAGQLGPTAIYSAQSINSTSVTEHAMKAYADFRVNGSRVLINCAGALPLSPNDVVVQTGQLAAPENAPPFPVPSRG